MFRLQQSRHVGVPLIDADIYLQTKLCKFVSPCVKVVLPPPKEKIGQAQLCVRLLLIVEKDLIGRSIVWGLMKCNGF